MLQQMNEAIMNNSDINNATELMSYFINREFQSKH
jgi:hypothetical protein